MAGKIIYIAVRVIAAFLMIQTLYFKFTGAEESIFIFETIGIEPWGRYAVGIGELIASILILVPRTAWIGGLMTGGLMFGAICMHFIFLGVEVMGDNGQLFIYAWVAMLCGTYVMHVNRRILERYLAIFNF